ncbi:MAG: hypothetical protein KA354_24220 [Phycisphaerae bacterium]|nr:hypothetical protein [Phycisphaerae bacterium]
MRRKDQTRQPTLVIPSTVCMRYDDHPAASEHFRLVPVCDSETNEVICHEPAVADETYKRIKRAQFRRLRPPEVDDRTANPIRLWLLRRTHSQPWSHS